MAAPLPRAPTCWLLLPLISGYLIAWELPLLPGRLAFAGLVTAGVTLAAAVTRVAAFTRLWPFAAFVAGTLLSAGFLQHRLQPPPGWENLPPREARLTFRIDSVFSTSAAGVRIHGLGTILKTESHLQELIGRKIYFSTSSTGEYDLWPRTTRLRASGVLEALRVDSPATDAFAAHLARSGAHFAFRRIVLRAEPLPGRGFFAFCQQQNHRFENYLRRGSDPNSETGSAANIFVGMLLGKRGQLAEEQKSVFLHTGTFHLFAISGLHIGVIAYALHSLLRLVRFREKPAAVTGLLLLFTFVCITGASPSAVRAFLMVSFFWGARFTERSPNSVAALSNSALLVLLLYPGQLWSPGFQLSYAVVSGILFLGLPLGRRLQETWTPLRGLPLSALTRFQRFRVSLVRETQMTLAISLAATLLSSPLCIHYFGLFTPGSVLANLLMIPAASLVIVSGFISVFLNMLALGPLAIVFNHAGWLIIALMEPIARVLLELPLFWKASYSTVWAAPAAVFAMLMTLITCAHQRWKAPLFHFAVPFAVFTIFLVTVVRLTFLGD